MAVPRHGTGALMWVLGPIGFTAPWLLLGLIALPVLWLLLRAVPPAPIRRRFPGVALLLGLTDDKAETDKTPWWLLLLRMLAVAAAIVAFAGPVLNPQVRQPGTGPLLILMDGGWADARDWSRRIDRASALIEDAGRAGRTVALLRLTDAPQAPAFQAANAWTGRVGALDPQPWAPADLAGWAAVLPRDGFDSFWLSDGLDHPGRADLLAALEAQGSVSVFESPRPVVTLRPAVFEDGVVKVQALRPAPGADAEFEVSALAPFPESSPFHGLVVPADVTVSSQVLAQPDPDLADRTIAALVDGTPLVTRKAVGQGQVVLVHVTANAEWSTLPLSGLFVQMLERLAVSTRPAAPEAGDLVGQIWVPEAVLDAYGTVADAGEVAGVAGEVLAEGIGDGPRAGLPPGLYAGTDRRVALNVIGPETVLAPAVWPDRIPVEGLAVDREQALKGAFLAAALAVLLVDILASLWLTGRLRAAGATVAVLALCLLAISPPAQAQQTGAQDDALALQATTAVVLAHVLTGDPQVDALAEAGLRGLGQKLAERTSIEPEAPIGVDLDRDELAFFPFLYWPVTATQPLPSAKAYAALNRYLRTGGMILFDTRDADVAGFGGTTPEGKRLQDLAAQLDVPPLEPIPSDHVLTRTFYLLQDFPGRYADRSIWVEASAPDAEQVEGMPFRNLNDGVTPVVIGGNDWASAWAVDETGVPLYPVGRGFAGERQREIAYRFGVNLIMHVLTGNYKSDQVHVPALLERLGQ